MNNLLRALPKVDRLAADPRLSAWPHQVAIAAARQVLQEVRAELVDGARHDLPDLIERVAERARWLADGRMVSVINATGVVVHTNLGRAPWSESARTAAQRVARACDLEMDRDTGERGGRLRGISAQLRHLTGAEAALVVNNNAAAVLLALTAHARGRDVIVSRGELVEIGGSFRVPDVIASGGARLVEVGTTNRTRIEDYAAAIGPDTAVLLKVHPSNFRMTGFTEAPSREVLVALGRARGISVIEDLGSGALAPLGGEPSVREVVQAGVDVVCFSGDKLLGGPQAGVIAGNAAEIERLHRHPLYRALRVDKVILAALEATVGDHLAGRPTPVRRMLEAPLAEVRARAVRFHALLYEEGGAGEIVEVGAVAGGGALPGQELPSAAVKVRSRDVEGLARLLRTGSPAVVGRVQDGALLLNLRTVADDEIVALAARVGAACRARP